MQAQENAKSTQNLHSSSDPSKFEATGDKNAQLKEITDKIASMQSSKTKNSRIIRDNNTIFTTTSVNAQTLSNDAIMEEMVEDSA